MDDIIVFSNVADYFSDVYLKNAYQHIDPLNCHLFESCFTSLLG